MSQDPTSNSEDFTGASFVTDHHDTYPYISPSKLDLSGKHILITGASKGIGRAIVLSYAAAGASCIVVTARSDLSSLSRDAERVAKDARRPVPKLVAVKMDVTDKHSVESAAKEVKEQVGYLDVIVNNAGVIEKPTPLLEIDPDAWWQTWETNIKGPFLVLRYFMPLLLAADHGRGDRTIVALSSIGAHLKSPGLSAYQPGKLALLRIMEFVNEEYGDQGILGYCVHPGGVMTEMGKSLGPGWEDMLKDKPELPGDTIAWLTSEKRDWLAGRYVSCTWDMDAFLKRRTEIVEQDLLKVKLKV